MYYNDGVEVISVIFMGDYVMKKWFLMFLLVITMFMFVPVDHVHADTEVCEHEYVMIKGCSVSRPVGRPTKQISNLSDKHVHVYCSKGLHDCNVKTLYRCRKCGHVKQVSMKTVLDNWKRNKRN